MMDINNLKMGDMFYIGNDTLVVVVEANDGPEKTLLLIDSMYCFYIDPKDTSVLHKWLLKIEGLEKMSICSVYKNIERNTR